MSRVPVMPPHGHTLSDVSVVDLFCGVGGMTRGFIDAGLRVAVGVDVEASCKFAYEANNEGARFEQRNVVGLEAVVLKEWFGDARRRILVGCAPCQPFTAYRRAAERRYSATEAEKETSATPSADDDWQPLRAFKQLVLESLPDVVSMENVPQLAGFAIYEEFKKALEDAGYKVWAEPVFCPNYGVPQRRTRLVVLASRLGEISLIPPTHSPTDYVTVRDAIGELPAIEDGQQDPDDPLHRASKLSDLNRRRIKASKVGGTWKQWPKDLWLECHKRDSGRTFGSMYGRMDWESPAPTMTTHCYGLGNGRFGHPEQDRAISLREAALLQTFPKDYAFHPLEVKPSIRAIARQIGNAVPVKLGTVIANSIRLHLEESQ